MPNLKKAELIEGVVLVDSTTTYSHATAHAALAGWLGFHSAATLHLIGSILGSVRLDPFNEVQPDVHLSIATCCGWQTRIGKGDIVEGAPELVDEVTYSSVDYDHHEKLEVYRRNGVCECVVWRLEDELIDWYVLRDGVSP